VTTDPAGAAIWLNDTEIGRSPTDTSFTFFGTYDIRVAKDGYETLNTTRTAVAPWYEYPFLDLFAIAAPWTIETRIDWHFTLEPLKPEVGTPDEANLLNRANELRRHLGPAPAPPETGPPESAKDAPAGPPKNPGAG
jgi:hypothetical protein